MVHCHRFQLNSTNFVADSPPLSPTQPAPPPASPCLVTGPSLAAQAPPGQSSASADHLHESELPRTAGDSAVNSVLVNGGTSTTDDVLVVKCGQCSTLNVISLAKDCWYVIFRGLGVGVQRDIVSSLAILPLSLQSPIFGYL